MPCNQRSMRRDAQRLNLPMYHRNYTWHSCSSWEEAWLDTLTNLFHFLFSVSRVSHFFEIVVVVIVVTSFHFYQYRGDGRVVSDVSPFLGIGAIQLVMQKHHQKKKYISPLCRWLKAYKGMWARERSLSHTRHTMYLTVSASFRHRFYVCFFPLSPSLFVGEVYHSWHTAEFRQQRCGNEATMSSA